jgi:hypothetical protein
MYSSNLVITVLNSGGLTGSTDQLVGSCAPVADPLIDAESDCKNLVGNVIKISRTCPTATCQLGLCGNLILSDCDCSLTEISADYVDITRGIPFSVYKNTEPLINNTDFKLKIY